MRPYECPDRDCSKLYCCLCASDKRRLCVYCNSSLSDKVHKLVTGKIDKIRFKCPNKGCDLTTLTYDAFDKHVSDECSQRKVHCENYPRCVVKMRREFLAERHKDKCNYRKVKCEYCHEEVILSEL